MSIFLESVLKMTSIEGPIIHDNNKEDDTVKAGRWATENSKPRSQRCLRLGPKPQYSSISSDHLSICYEALIGDEPLEIFPANWAWARATKLRF